MSEDYIVYRGQRYRREGTGPSEPSQLRPIGEILSESVGQGRSVISGFPQAATEGPMNPYATPCLACGHTLIETSCPQHGSGGDYLYFPGSDPPGHFHRKCLEALLAERSRQIQEAVNSDGQ